MKLTSSASKCFASTVQFLYYQEMTIRARSFVFPTNKIKLIKYVSNALETKAYTIKLWGILFFYICKHNQLQRICPSGNIWNQRKFVQKIKQDSCWTNSCYFSCCIKVYTLIKMTLLLFKWLFTSVCVILYHTKISSAQNDYVDFLRKANDRLTVDLLSALAGRYWYVSKLWLFIQ